MFKFRKYNTANRFTLILENFSSKIHGLGDYIRDATVNAKVDYHLKTITFEVFDLEGGTSERFFDMIDQDPELLVRLQVHSGDMEVDYTKRFFGAKLVSRTIDYSYDSPEVARHRCLITFERSELESFLPIDE